MAPEPGKSLSPFPMRAIGAALLLTAAVFLFTGIFIYRSFLHYSERMKLAFHLQESVNALGAAPTVTLLARAAADTDNPRLEMEYLVLVNEIGEALDRIQSHAPTGDIRLAAETLHRVSETLLATEQEAFELVRAGKSTQASDLLQSEPYRIRVQQFDHFYRMLDTSIKNRGADDLNALARQAFLVLGANTATIPILAFVWLNVLRIVRRHVRERNELEERLQGITLQDDLTGLYNRRGFMALAEQQIRIADRTEKPLALLFADMDGLKRINDTHGHLTGDLMLIEAATLLSASIRESDVVARIGGDEFVALLMQADKDVAEHLVRRVQGALHERNAAAEPDDPRLSLSVGYVVYNPESACSIDELIAQADQVMYQKKRARKDPDTREIPSAVQ